MMFPAKSSSWNLRSPLFLLSPISKPSHYSPPRLSFILRTLTALAILSIITYYTLSQSDSSSTKVHEIIDDVLGGLSSINDDNGRAAWIEKSLASDIDGEFDGGAIKSVCAKKRFDHRVAISCGRIQGGVGNVRNVILTCLRFVIEAGGDFVVPDIQSRSGSDLSILDTGTSLGFDYMFDEAYFKKTLKKVCPGMKVYGSNDRIETGQDATELDILELLPKMEKRVLGFKDAAAWGGNFEKWLINQEATNADKLSSGPIPVDIGSPLFMWPVSYDGLEFANSFGRIMRLREDTRRLAAVVLYELSREFDLDLEPTEFMTGGMFFGAHLRTAEDASKAHWTGYDLQAEKYLEQASKDHLSTIYVATGSTEDLERFSKQAWSQYQFNTTSKLHLLRGDDLALLQSLSWDQQGLVDFLVMLKASSFAGIEQSSFAWNIALKRHILSQDANYLTKGIALKDEYSMLLGPEGASGFIGEAMWP